MSSGAHLWLCETLQVKFCWDCFYSFMVSQNHLVTLHMFHRTRFPRLTLAPQEGNWNTRMKDWMWREVDSYQWNHYIYILKHLSDAVVTYSNSYIYSYTDGGGCHAVLTSTCSPGEFNRQPFMIFTGCVHPDDLHRWTPLWCLRLN